MAEIVLLQTSDGRSAETLGQFRRFAKAFISASPSFVAWHRDAGSKRPVEAGRPNFFTRDAGCAFHQSGIARAPQADVVREHHRIQHIVVSVHGINAKKNWNCQTSLQRLSLKSVVHVGPGFEAVARLWI